MPGCFGIKTLFCHQLVRTKQASLNFVPQPIHDGCKQDKKALGDPVSMGNQTEETKRAGLRPLARLLPYILRYKGHVAGALIFLVMAATTMLSLPLAVRSMLDNGFSKPMPA